MKRHKLSTATRIKQSKTREFDRAEVLAGRGGSRIASMSPAAGHGEECGERVLVQ